ncbi:MAG: TadA family conjugal transfer-associated ATPase [Corynebacterium sp.]|nr:TadA family conjugal transfer-associated ATPase [Corynebacterium sp.]
MDKREIIERVQRQLASSDGAYEPQVIAGMVRETAGVISDHELFEILQTIRFDSVGIGPLEQLMGIPGLSDIVVNGPEEVWVSSGGGMRKAALSFENEEAVRALAQRLAARCGVRLDDAHPWADGRIMRPDGIIRFHALLSPPSDRGVLLSLRMLRRANHNLADLGYPEEVVGKLRDIVLSKKSLLVVGGTGSGKTTLLSALLGEVPHEERIICLEDTAELQPNHPHVVSLVSRGPNIEGKGAISIATLLKQSLRMRPDRIIVGEIRGAEVVDLLSALNTGHEGGGGTVHANSIHEVPARMEALAALGGMEARVLHTQLDAAVDVIIHVKDRAIAALGELHGTKVETIWEAA